MSLHKHHDLDEDRHGGGSNAVYALGLFGAWAYYLKGVTTFEEGAKGFFKGLFWPAFLVYELLTFLGKK